MTIADSPTPPLGELWTEMFAAAERVEQRHLDHMHSLGVATHTIARLNINVPVFGIVNAETDRHGRYQPCDGPAHVVMPVTERGDLIDLVAWRASQPGQWWTRTGIGWAIGADDLGEISRWSGPPPLIAETPLDWLRGDGLGSVILDWSPMVMTALRSHGRITCTTNDLATRLRTALSRSVRLPVINVEERARHAA